MAFNMTNFLENHFLQLLTPPAVLTVAKTPTSGNFINVAPYARFGFLIEVGATTSDLVFQVQQDKGATQTGSIKNITGATVTLTATQDNKIGWIEVAQDRLDMNNGFAYVTLDMTGAAGADDYGSVVFVGIELYDKNTTSPDVVASAVIAG